MSPHFSPQCCCGHILIPPHPGHFPHPYWAALLNNLSFSDSCHLIAVKSSQRLRRKQVKWRWRVGWLLLFLTSLSQFCFTKVKCRVFIILSRLQWLIDHGIVSESGSQLIFFLFRQNSHSPIGWTKVSSCVTNLFIWTDFKPSLFNVLSIQLLLQYFFYCN